MNQNVKSNHIPENLSHLIKSEDRAKWTTDLVIFGLTFYEIVYNDDGTPTELNYVSASEQLKKEHHNDFNN